MNPNTVVLFDDFHSDNIKRIFSLDSAEQRYLEELLAKKK